MFAAGNNQIKDFFNALGPVDYEEKHSDSPFVVGMPGTPWKDYSFITAHIITG